MRRLDDSELPVRLPPKPGTPGSGTDHWGIVKTKSRSGGASPDAHARRETKRSWDVLSTKVHLCSITRQSVIGVRRLKARRGTRPCAPSPTTVPAPRTSVPSSGRTPSVDGSSDIRSRWVGVADPRVPLCRPTRSPKTSPGPASLDPLPHPDRGPNVAGAP